MVRSLYCSTELLMTTSAGFYLQIPQNMLLHIRSLGNANNISQTLGMVFLHANPFTH